MTRLIFRVGVVLMLCLAVTVAQAAQRGKGGEKKEGGKPPSKGEAERKPQGKEKKEPTGRESSGQSNAERGSSSAAGKSAPGGAWSDRTHSGPTSSQAKGESGTSNAAGAPTGTAASTNKATQPTGAQGAAAGSAAAKNNSPSATGAQGAAAGAAAVNRNNPTATGAQGAAAGAAAANRNSPAATGAQGAAVGAAAVNRNSPAATGAQGAAVGAAAANRNSPQLSGAQGAAVGAAAANLNSPAVSGAAGAATGYAAVRNSFDNPNIYGQAWYGAHPNAWAPAGWAAGAAWAPTSWGTFAGLYGYGNAAPINYNYGAGVNYQNGNVLVAGQSVGTADEFSQQAAQLAATGAAADVSGSGQWMPLGVFAMVRNENQHPQLIVQMALNEQGAADKETQRVAWTVGDNTQTVMEAGLSNLTQNEAPALVHKNGKTDHWILVRLEQPK
jgi:hypothetical protein